MDVQAELAKLTGKPITVGDTEHTFQIDGRLAWDGCRFSVERRYGSLSFLPEQAVGFRAGAGGRRWLVIRQP